MSFSEPISSADMSDLRRMNDVHGSIDGLLSESSSGLYADGFDDRPGVLIDHPPKKLKHILDEQKAQQKQSFASRVTGDELPAAAARLFDTLASESSVLHNLPKFPPTSSRFRHATTSAVNRAIDERTSSEVRAVEHDRARITAKITELQYEWDVDRFVELQASVTLFAFSFLAIFQGSARWLYLSLIFSGLLLMHALHGWSPILDLLRMFGIRTSAEIHEEVVALKAIRGDFGDLQAFSVANVIRHSRIVPTVCDKLPSPAPPAPRHATRPEPSLSKTKLI